MVSRLTLLLLLTVLELASCAKLGYKDQCELDIDCRDPERPLDVNKCCAQLIYEASDGV